MKSPLISLLSLGLTSLLLAACSTPQSNHYRLTALASLDQLGDSPSLGVGPVSIPEYLNRDALVLSDGGTALAIDSGERWAEPLDDGIQRVLGLNLAGLLHTQDVRRFPWPPQQRPEYAVEVRILALEAGGGTSILVAEWRLYQTEAPQGGGRRLVQLEHPLSSARASAGEVTAAYSTLLFSLSEEIARALAASHN